MDTERARMTTNRDKIAFCFPGQGSLEPGMGQEIAQAVPEAMRVFEEASEASGLDLRELCFNTRFDELVETEVQQPALITTSLAVLAALRKLGVEPDYVVGHSVGEFSALAAAESMSIADTVSLVRERGLATAEAARERPGSMAAILGLDDPVVEEICSRIEGVWPANYNCPGQVVVSGEHAAVRQACIEAERAGARRTVRLRVTGAFHSPLIEKAADRLRPAVERIRVHEPSAPFMSTVSAKIEPAQRVAGLLVEQLTSPVRFTQAASGLVRDGVKTFVEVGPGNVLSGLVKRIDRSVKTIPVNSLAGLRRVEHLRAS
jgi:[acyl-carrier-protein] S-malonyltransferase